MVNTLVLNMEALAWHSNGKYLEAVLLKALLAMAPPKDPILAEEIWTNTSSTAKT
jgi:hypothetical protein